MDDDIIEILRTAKRIAVVGLSDDPTRASSSVATYLIREGYEIIPVNPTTSEALGRKSYASLRDVPPPVDIVDIFRRPEAVDEIVDDAIAIGAKLIWMQLGIINEAAAAKAHAAGLLVVMDHCLHIEHANLKMDGLLYK
jgi:predicted CoA-binding protein